MCKALKFAGSTCYEAPVRVPSNKEQEYLKFSAEVKQCFEENKKRYGAVRIYRKLNENGFPCSIRRVQRHMQRRNLRSVVVKKYNHKTGHGKVSGGKENILSRNFKAETINRKWVTDITYIHVRKEGRTYPASVMDLYDRKIIGYAYGKNMTADLALDAVKNACLNVPDTNGIILHSDLGSQYTGDLFEGYMRSNGFVHSYSSSERNAIVQSYLFGISRSLRICSLNFWCFTDFTAIPIKNLLTRKSKRYSFGIWYRLRTNKLFSSCLLHHRITEVLQ